MFLLHRGVIDDVAMMVHLVPEEVCACTSPAITDLPVRYTGAVAAPLGGRNIVSTNTSARYAARAPDVESRQQLRSWTRVCIEAGALATGCAHEVIQASPVSLAAYRVAITGLGCSSLSRGRAGPPDWQHRRGQPDPGAADDPSNVAIDCE